MTHAVIVVSGGDATSPYTTPTAACAHGLAAGNTDTYLRARLLDAGHAVYTAPATNVPGVVQDPRPDSFGAFGGQPRVLPADLTILSNGPIDEAGARLARFAGHLVDVAGVREVSWVAHSNGGLFAVAAIGELGRSGSPLRTRTLVTLGTPWTGSAPLRVVVGELPDAVLLGDERAQAVAAELARWVAGRGGDLGLAWQDTHAYLLGADGWLARQAGVLADVPVLLVAGTWLTHDGGDPQAWPSDGLVGARSALARDVGPEVLADRVEFSADLLHSIHLADRFGQPWATAMTWSPAVSSAVLAHLADR